MSSKKTTPQKQKINTADQKQEDKSIKDRPKNIPLMNEELLKLKNLALQKQLVAKDEELIIKSRDNIAIQESLVIESINKRIGFNVGNDYVLNPETGSLELTTEAKK